MESKTKTRLPRYQRLAQEKPSLMLQERDIEIIHTVYEYRFLNSKLIKTLIPGSDQTILRRLQKLYHQSYLERLKGSLYQPILYALGNKGAEILTLHYGLDPGKIDWVKKNREVKERYIDHTLQIANFRATLTLALQTLPNSRILNWVPEGRLKETITLKDKKQSMVVMPDGFFVLDDQGEEMYFFLEADRSTMTNQRFLGKMRAYWGLWREEKIREKLGLLSFRVLTITKSEARKENLRAITKYADDKHIGSEMFWFTSETNYNIKNPQAILKAIWQTPKNDNLHYLLE